MYREGDPAAERAQAHDECVRAFRELQVACAAARQASARQVQAQQPPIEIPDYEPVPATAPVARYQSLTSFYGEEAARLARATAAAEIAQAENAADRPLRTAPRAVPATYRLAEHVRGYWLVLRWLLFPPLLMPFGAALFGLSRLQPWAMLAPLAVLALYAAGRGARRIRLLRLAAPAEIMSRSYAPGMGRSQNWPRQMARGWTVTVKPYTGMTYRTTVTYRAPSGGLATVVIGGPRYEGVVLVEPATGEARPLTAFGSVPRPDGAGDWDPTLPGRVWRWIGASVVLVAAWVAVVAVLATRHG